jgi:hypothetical protein
MYVVCSSQFAHYIRNFTHPLERKLLVAMQMASKNWVVICIQYDGIHKRKSVTRKKDVRDHLGLFEFESTSDVTQTESWLRPAICRMII